MRWRRLLPLAVLLIAGFAYPAVAGATTVDFETPALADGTIVTNQFATPGVTFGAVPAHDSQTPGSQPIMHVGADARSGSHALDISTNEAEFPVASLEGDFSTTQNAVSIDLRNITSGSFTVNMQLQLFDSQHDLLATSGGGAFTPVASTDSGYTELSAATTGDVASFWVVTDGASNAQGQIVLADDLSFTGSGTGTPAISLENSLSGATVVHQAASASAAVAIQRINGSDGDANLSFSGLPAGVTAVAAPNPVTGTGSAATVTFTAAVDAPVVSTPVPVTITGTPGPGAGSIPSSTTIELEVAPYPPGDLVATGIEVNQAIQTPADAIPLVGDKQTAVRVYLRGIPDAAGLWSNVGARLIVGSHVYAPVNSDTVTASPTGSDRGSLTDSFIFVLSPADTAPGVRTLTAVVIPPTGRPESDAANDSISTTVQFGPSRDFQLYAFTYGQTHPTVAQRPWSDFEAHREYMENVHPLSSLSIVPLPGDPSMTFDNGDGNAYLNANTWLDDEISMLYPTGTVSAYMMTPDTSSTYEGWCCTGGPNWVLRGNDNRSDPGPTLAHESGHRWGLLHTFSDPNYPRPTGALGGPLGPQVGVRFQPSLTVVPGEDAAGNSITNDMMSYTSPFWVSPYNYCNLLSGYSAGAITCSAAAKVASVGSTQSGTPLNPASRVNPQFGIRSGSRRFLYVNGILSPSGKATFGAFEQVQSATRLTTRSDGSKFRVELRARSGRSLASWGFNRVSDVHTEPIPAPFEAWLPYPRGVATIVLVSGDKVVTRRSVSAHAPTLRVLNLRATTLKGMQTIHWHGSDADRQRLTYGVEYSADAGKTWIPLDMDLHGGSAQLNFTRVPISRQAKLRVAASDGVNTTYATIGHEFRVPGGNPTVTIEAPSKTGGAGTATVVSASALDSEGGPVFADSAFTWTENGQVLGSGSWLVVNLKSGLHTIAVEVRDRFGRSATKSVQVHVL